MTPPHENRKQKFLEDIMAHAVEPPPFVPASLLASMNRAERHRLFNRLYEMKHSDDEYRAAAGKVAMNSTYGQMGFIDDMSRFEGSGR